MKNRWGIGNLRASHDRSSFDCGNPQLNNWLQQEARQFERRGLSRTYVAIEGDGECVLGYYSLSAHRVVYKSLPAAESKGLPNRIGVPVVLLGQLAVDKTAQGSGLGKYLLIDALRRVAMVAEQVGVRAVEVYAIDEQARSFYLKYGFVSLKDDMNHLYLPMRIIEKLNLA